MAQNANHAITVLEAKRMREQGTRVEYGSLDGTLTELSAQQSQDKIIIVDGLTGYRTRCYFRTPDLEQLARTAWKRRVEASGEITTDAEGNPVEMAVDRLRVFRDRAELPQMRDLFGIDVTGGIESSEYVRGLRNDD